MRPLHSRLAIASLGLLVLTTTGCWPGIPIAIIVAASGGGGGGGGGQSGVTLAGTVITDATAGLSLSFDHEPNDTLGNAMPVEALTGQRPRHIEGRSGAAASVHALVADASGTSILAQELLTDETIRFATRAAPGGSPRHLARSGRELFIVDAADPGTGREARVRVVPLVSDLAKRDFALATAGTPAGLTVCLDALLVLDSSPVTAHLVACDSANGAPLVIADLRRNGLAHLAGGEELLSGRTRLFTTAPGEGRILEIGIARRGHDHHVDGIVAGFAPAGLDGAIQALGYDGVLVHVVDGAGTLRSFDPDTGAAIAARPLVARGTSVLSLVAHLDLGLDGYRVALAGGESLPVTLLASSDAGHLPFAFALPRTHLRDGDVDATGPEAWVALDGANRSGTLSLAPSAAPRSFDLVVGSLAGSGTYRLQLGAQAQGLDAPDADPPARGDAARLLAAHLEGSIFPRLTHARIAALYRDPLLPDFIPNRLVLGRRDVAAELALPPAPTGFALTRVESSPSGWDILAHRTTPDWSAAAATTIEGVSSRTSRSRVASRETLVLLEGLAGAAGVAWSEPQYLAHALATPTDPQIARQIWQYAMLNLPAAWDLTTGAASTVLAAVDTGVRTENADLSDNIDPANAGFDFIADATPPGSDTGSADNDGRDTNPYDEGNFGGGGAHNSHHGSHVSGTMGAQANNGNQGSGICWDCSLMPLRALDVAGSGSTTDIAEAIKYAAGVVNASGLLPSQNAAVINLSLGLSTPSNAIHNAMLSAIANNSIICCAAGNDGNGTAVLFPAAYSESICVAAADFNGNIATYSNTGPEIDVTAPGGSNAYLDFEPDGVVDTEVQSTTGVGPNGSLQPLAGTSMACAHASGVCGLMKTVFPALTQDDALKILIGTAVNIGPPGFDNFSGFGMIDAAAAVNGATPVIDLSATVVDFGSTGTDLVVQARNAGIGTLTVSSLNISTVQGSTSSWLNASMASDGMTILLTADRTGIANGSYQAQVDVVSNGGNASFLVGLAAGAGGVTDLGTITIQVVADNGTTVVSSTTTTAAAGYAWSLNRLGNTRFFVRCGVDVNHDGTLDKNTEPYGAYPSVAEEKLLDLALLTNLRLDLLIE